MADLVERLIWLQALGRCPCKGCKQARFVYLKPRCGQCRKPGATLHSPCCSAKGLRFCSDLCILEWRRDWGC